MDPSFIHLLSFFLLLFFSYQNLTGMARSDDSLINTLCSKTEEPVICRECLQLDPNSKSENGQGLALVAIACAERDTTFLHEDTLNLLHNATSQSKGILDDCTQHLFLAKHEFPPVAGYVQEGRYRSYCRRDHTFGHVLFEAVRTNSRIASATTGLGWHCDLKPNL